MQSMRIFGLLALMLAIPSFTIGSATNAVEALADAIPVGGKIEEHSFRQAPENEAALERRITKLTNAVEVLGKAGKETQEKAEQDLEESAKNINCTGNGMNVWVNENVYQKAKKLVIARGNSKNRSFFESLVFFETEEEREFRKEIKFCRRVHAAFKKQCEQGGDDYLALEQRIANVRVLTQNFENAARAVEASGDMIAEDEEDELALKEGTKNMNCTGDGSFSWVEMDVLEKAQDRALVRANASKSEADIADNEFEQALIKCKARYADHKVIAALKV